MTIYVTFYTDFDDQPIMDKAFTSQEKAKAYTLENNRLTEYGWFCEELEVEE
jgi:hypothetical protein